MKIPLFSETSLFFEKLKLSKFKNEKGCHQVDSTCSPNLKFSIRDVLRLRIIKNDSPELITDSKF